MFERLGIEATHEVQAAGRRVAAENALLRSLLRLHGVTDAEVEEYLKSQRDPTSPGPSTVTPLLPTPRPPPASDPPPTVSSDHLMKHQLSQPIPSHPETSRVRDNQLQEPDVVGVASSPPKPVAIGHVYLPNGPDSCGEWPAAVSSVNLEPSSELQQSRGQLDTGQVTSCETAARIITMMRGYSDTQDARAELGCSSESNCMVKNMAIFEILDR